MHLLQCKTARVVVHQWKASSIFNGRRIKYEWDIFADCKGLSQRTLIFKYEVWCLEVR